MAARSKMERRLTAEITPMLMPMISQTTAAPPISESVRGAFSMILSLIGTLEPYE